ncbi:Predicted membrane protein [Lachnospiraceae bacterium NE2001]|nr:Predicted membrane protein [Lachnospiraceae bacterium NE2001]
MKKLIDIFKNKENILYLVFAVFILVQGLIFSFIVPFGQVPDEMTHYQLIEEEWGKSGYYNEIVAVVWQGGGYSSLPGNAEAKVDDAAVDSISNVKFSKGYDILEFRPHLNMIRHLPAATGFYIGVALHRPIIACAHMAEIFATIFFVVMGILTLKTTPIKKEIFAFCLLIPQCIQQCTSVNYDSVVIPTSIFLFAYILKLYYSDEKIKWKQMAILAVVSLVVLVTKAPYVLILLSIFIIPISRFELKIGKKFEAASFFRKFWYIFLALIIVVGVLGVYLLRRSPEIKTLVADILSFPSFVSLLYRTYAHWGYYHLQQMVGMFGWIDSVVTSQFLLLFFGMMVYLNVCIVEKVEKKLNFPRRLLLFIVAVAIVVLIEAALQTWTYKYLEWDTMAGIDVFRQYNTDLTEILGVQGRYWIPCLPLILVSLSGTIERKKVKVYYGIQFAYYIIALFNVITLLLSRYWMG